MQPSSCVLRLGCWIAVAVAAQPTACGQDNPASRPSDRDLRATIRSLVAHPSLDAAPVSTFQPGSQPIQIEFDSGGAWMIEPNRVRAFGPAGRGNPLSSKRGASSALPGSLPGRFTVSGQIAFFRQTDELWRSPIGKEGLTWESVALPPASTTEPVVHGRHPTLCAGPDGWIYFSGPHLRDEANVLTHIAPDRRGLAILRCQPDGTMLELFASGFVDPVSLSFDSNGDLWALDRPAFQGDPARCYYVPRWADIGWHSGWEQVGADRLWKAEGFGAGPASAHNTAAGVTPPVLAWGNDPIGLLAPGTFFLTPQLAGHLIVADRFGGIAAFQVNTGSYLRLNGLPAATATDTSIRLTRRDSGITGVCVDANGFLNILSSGIYPESPRRVLYRVYPKQPPVSEDDRRAVMRDLSGRQLERFMQHPNRMLRAAAQFELVAREEVDRLLEWVGESNPSAARRHAIRALGQLLTRRHGRSDEIAATLVPAVDDADPKIRVEAIRAIGDARWTPAALDLRRHISDPNRRAQLQALLSLACIGSDVPIELFTAAIDDTVYSSAFARHGFAAALARCSTPKAIMTLARHPDRAVRLVLLTALRKLAHPDASVFLHDPDPFIASEAARAVHDSSFEEGLSQLAALAVAQVPAPSREEPNPAPMPLMLRAINSNWRLGKTEHALTLLELAASDRASISVRVAALESLGDWNSAGTHDRLTGLELPRSPRDPRTASIPLRMELPALMNDAPFEVRAAALEAAQSLNVQVRPRFSKGSPVKPANPSTPPPSVSPTNTTPISSSIEPSIPKKLAAVETRDSTPGPAQTEAAPRVNTSIPAGNRLEPTGPPEDVQSPGLTDAVDAESIGMDHTAAQIRRALKTAARDPARSFERLLRAYLNRFLNHQFPTELALELDTAITRTATPELRAEWDAQLSVTPGDDPRFSPLLFESGGNPNLGKRLFHRPEDLGCVKCHRPTLSISGSGARRDESGPGLKGIALRKKPATVLTDILYPNRNQTEGFERSTFTLVNGQKYSGWVDDDNPANVSLNLSDGSFMMISKKRIAQRINHPTSMPSNLGETFTREQIRDLLAYLMTLK